jgi:RNA polymerase sigma factor (sigma-70 family)
MESSRPKGLDILIRKVAAHDEQAFITLIELTLPRITRIIRRHAGDAPLEEIEDIQLEVLVKIWFKASTFSGRSRVGSDPDATAYAWICRIADNTRKDHFRGNKWKERVPTESELWREEDDPENEPSPLEQYPDPAAPNPEKVIIKSQGIGEFMAELSPVECRIIEYLHRGYSQKEIAASLGMTPSAISQHMDKLKTKGRDFMDRSILPGDNDGPFFDP